MCDISAVGGAQRRVKFSKHYLNECPIKSIKSFRFASRSKKKKMLISISNILNV